MRRNQTGGFGLQTTDGAFFISPPPPSPAIHDTATLISRRASSPQLDENHHEEPTDQKPLQPFTLDPLSVHSSTSLLCVSLCYKLEITGFPLPSRTRIPLHVSPQLRIEISDKDYMLSSLSNAIHPPPRTLPPRARACQRSVLRVFLTLQKRG